MTEWVLTPAYNYDYKSVAEVVTALNKGFDFRAHTTAGSTYCSIRDIPDGEVEVRYAKRQKIAIIKIVKGVAQS